MKKIVSILLVAMTCVSLVGCGNETNDKVVDKETNISTESGESSSNLEDSTSKNEEETKEEVVDLLEDITTEVSGSSSVNLIGELREETSDISFTIPSKNLESHTVFTYDFGVEGIDVIRPADEKEYFYFKTMDMPGSYVSMSKTYSSDYQRFMVTMGGECFSPNENSVWHDESVEFTVVDDADLSNYDTLEKFKEHYADDYEEVNSSWEYDGYFILPYMKDEEHRQYRIYKVSELENELIRIELKLYSKDIQKDYVEAFLNNVSIEYVISNNGFDKTKCYLEDAIANIIANKTKFYIKYPQNMVDTRMADVGVAIVENGQLYICNLSINRYENLDFDDDIKLGKYKEYLVCTDEDKSYLSFTIYNELNKVNKNPEYIKVGISSRTFSSKSADISIEALKDNFLN